MAIMKIGKLTLGNIFSILRLTPEAEYRFHPTRRWRFDYAFPDKMIAIEYEGIYNNYTGKSRHTSMKGYSNDCEKYNEAAILGWKVLRFTAKHLTDGTALRQIEHALGGSTD